MPAGTYRTKVVASELRTSRNETPAYTLQHEIVQGEHVGRILYQDFWLTKKALPMSKRDLAKFQIGNPSQLEKPIPKFFVCRVKVVLRTSDVQRRVEPDCKFEVCGVSSRTTGRVCSGPRIKHAVLRTVSWTSSSQLLVADMVRVAVRHVPATGLGLPHCVANLDIDTGHECYLSAFQFGDEFQSYLESRDTTRGFDGECCADWVWFDLDGADAHDDARALTTVAR